MMQVKNT